MVKLIYPIDGLSGSTNIHTDACRRNLVHAYNKCNFTIPNNFSYKNYVSGLSSTIASYVKEIDDIKSKIRYIDSSMNNLDVGLSKNISTDCVSVKKRNRLIKY